MKVLHLITVFICLCHSVCLATYLSIDIMGKTFCKAHFRKVYFEV